MFCLRRNQLYRDVQVPLCGSLPIFVGNSTWWELERRLALIFLGKSHSSSAVHEMVIRDFEHSGPQDPKLEALRQTAVASRNAIYAGDFTAFGAAMAANTEGQRNLHPSLVNADAQQVIEIAREHGALGWKVNGAGGDGGSVTILSGPRMSEKRAMLRAIEETNPLYQNIPIYLSRMGLRVWQREPDNHFA